MTSTIKPWRRPRQPFAGTPLLAADAQQGSKSLGPKLSYNTVFERLVRSDDDIEGFIAYGLYKLAKREWNLQHQDEASAPPTQAELAAYHRTWTDTALQSLRDNAEAALSNYAQEVVQAARPTIEAEALRRGRPVWKDVLIAVASAFTYSLLLLLAALIIRHLGVDLVEVARGGRHAPTPASAPPSH